MYRVKVLKEYGGHPKGCIRVITNELAREKEKEGTVEVLYSDDPKRKTKEIKNKN